MRQVFICPLANALNFQGCLARDVRTWPHKGSIPSGQQTVQQPPSLTLGPLPKLLCFRSLPQVHLNVAEPHWKSTVKWFWLLFHEHWNGRVPETALSSSPKLVTYFLTTRRSMFCCAKHVRTVSLERLGNFHEGQRRDLNSGLPASKALATATLPLPQKNWEQS